MKINIWDLWAKEWGNASKFFNTKGNAKTKSKLKKKWHTDFKNMCLMIEKEVSRNNTKKG